MRMQIVIEIDERDFNYCQMLDKYNMGNSVNSAIVNGVIIPEHHGDLKDIGNMEILNVQVHDDYSKGWHNAIEYCVRQLRERPTIIPATKEGAE